MLVPQESVAINLTYTLTNKSKQKKCFSKCLLRIDVLRVFVLFCVLVFVRAILSWCP